ncbi:MAG: DUF5711 family protein [Saccharofermentanales bacterium]
MVPRRTLQKKNKAGLISLVLLAVILMAASITLALRFPEENIWENSSEIDINNPAQSGFLCDAVEAQKLYPFGNGLIKLNHDRISYLDLKGVEVFGEAVSMEAPFCRISSGKAFVGDSNGVQYLAMDTSKIIYKANAKDTINYGSINEDGYAAIIMDEPGLKGLMRILKPDGTGIYSWQSAESGYILSAQVNPDSTGVDVSVVNTDGTKVVPMLKRFGIQGDAKGQFIPQINELLPILLYDADMNPVICGASKIFCFDESKEKFQFSFSKIYTAASSDYGILLIARKLANDIPMLYLIKKDGTVSEGIALSDEVTSIAVKDSKAAIGSGNNVVCVSLNKMTEISRKLMSATVIRVGFSTGSNQVVVVARDGVTTFTP